MTNRQVRGRAPGEVQWYLDAVLYELHVRSFQDSNGDGIGDFPGLTRRLPYLQDLGVTAVWLLPFYPSPLRDDGYDIADYTGVHPDYGTLDDFRTFLDEAHRLGLRVITELVINHTSDRHAWFRRARAAPPGSVERNFYVWSDSPDRYRGARVIFQDFERSNWSWDPVARAYFWHRFYSHQPDLNYDNAAVFDAVVAVLDFWLRLGVDGMRLDAVPYLVEREGTHSENLGATHDVVKRLRTHIDRTYTNRILIAEANQWPEDAAAYFGKGDESHMVFHFPLMPRLFMAIRQEERLPIVDILAQTPSAPRGCQWALFLRNHDELTLEMVTEEERLYMYHVYATEADARINLGIRRRLAPLLGNDRRRIELMNALLCSLAGTPVIYYGDEIGMGDNIHLGDRNGVRTPMQWSADRNAGFSDASSDRLFLPLITADAFHYQAVHVAQQQKNYHSLLWWMKRLIAIRRRYQAFGRGDLVLVESQNMRALAFLRRWGEQQVLVVANLSRFVQHVELDVRGLAGLVPVEVFGRGSLPPIGAGPYPVMLGPHAFLWLELTSPGSSRRRSAIPRVQVEEGWEDLLRSHGRADLESILPSYVERCTAWNSAARTVLSVHVEDAIPVGTAAGRRWLTVIRVAFSSGEPERYLLPLGCRAVETRRGRRSGETVADLTTRGGGRQRFELFDAAEDLELAAALLRRLSSENSLQSPSGALEVVVPDAKKPLASLRDAPRQLRRARRGSNALVAVGGRVVLKLFRTIEPGPNPEIEMRSRLAQVGFRHSAALLAGLRWRFGDGRLAERAWVGILQEFVPNQGEAWGHAVTAASDYLRRAARKRGRPPRVSSIVPPAPWNEAAAPDAKEPLDALIGPYLSIVRRLAERTADLHRALSTDTSDPAFAPEPYSPFSRRSKYQRMRRIAVWVLESLRSRAPGLDADVREIAGAITRRRADALAVFRRFLQSSVTSLRIRCHGNLHLGQVLYAGDDFVIIDFDGEPGRPIYERRLKQSPLYDVATMVRSFHYAAYAAFAQAARAQPASRRAARRGEWMRAWQHRVGAVFVEAYCTSVAGSGLLPADPADARAFFHSFLLERAFYEVGFELNRQSPWIRAPLLDLPLLLEPAPFLERAHA